MRPPTLPERLRPARPVGAWVDTLAPVRRWLSILMLVLLPLQFSWAAVASYCEHERGAEAVHVGHHAHEHAASADAGENGKPAGFDVDCGHCHGQLAVPALRLTAPALAGSAGPLVPTAADAVRAPPSPRPERPQWAHLA